jgi:hypothetical protein
MLSLVLAVLFGCLGYGKAVLQTTVQVNSLGRNVELGGISYFIPGWPEVRSKEPNCTERTLNPDFV